MKNLAQMMKQLQATQAKVAELQAALDRAEIVGASGGGMVSVTLSGRGEVRRVKIDPKLVDSSEVEVLEDLIVAAFNDARAKVEAHAQAEMAKLTGGLPLPEGFKLPF
jgi:hypothetical protein